MPESTTQTPSKRAPKTAKKTATKAASKPAVKRTRKTAVSAPETASEARVGLDTATLGEVPSAPAKAAKRTLKPKVQADGDAAPKEAGAALQGITANPEVETPKTRRPRKKADASADAKSGSGEPD
jgi:hypothetical protein